MRTNTQQSKPINPLRCSAFNYLENIRRMVIGKIWVKAMAAAIALATALNACSSDNGDGGEINMIFKINPSTIGETT